MITDGGVGVKEFINFKLGTIWHPFMLISWVRMYGRLSLSRHGAIYPFFSLITGVSSHPSL